MMLKGLLLTGLSFSFSAFAGVYDSEFQVAEAPMEYSQTLTTLDQFELRYNDLNQKIIGDRDSVIEKSQKEIQDARDRLNTCNSEACKDEALSDIEQANIKIGQARNKATGLQQYLEKARDKSALKIILVTFFDFVKKDAVAALKLRPSVIDANPKGFGFFEEYKAYYGTYKILYDTNQVVEVQISWGTNLVGFTAIAKFIRDNPISADSVLGFSRSELQNVISQGGSIGSDCSNGCSWGPIGMSVYY